MDEQGISRATPPGPVDGTTRTSTTPALDGADASAGRPGGASARPGRTGRGGRRRRTPLVAAVALVLVATAPIAWVQVGGRLRVHPGVEDVPARPVALVLGAGLRPDGTPSTYLTRRLDAARELYERGTVEVVLVSGDGSREDYDEPTAMLDWLVAHGVPAERVVRDSR